jgi:soluble lytic murein transglycosylase-like protein
MKSDAPSLPAGRARRAVAAVLLLAAATAHGQIYMGSEPATGAVVLSNFRSDATSALVDGTTQPQPQAEVPPAMPSTAQAPRAATAGAPRPPAELHSVVERVASRHKLSPGLLNAVIRAESGYDPRAVSPKGAVGLMQLMPATGRRFGAQDLFSVEQNVEAGAGYLGWLMSMFDGQLDLVLAAYNAGEQAVIDAGCRIPAYPETQAYVKRILDDLKRRGEPSRRGQGAYVGGCA